MANDHELWVSCLSSPAPVINLRYDDNMIRKALLSPTRSGPALNTPIMPLHRSLLTLSVTHRVMPAPLPLTNCRALRVSGYSLLAASIDLS